MTATCHWHRAEDGTTTLIPGCWGRVHDPDADCTCGAWSEDTARETIRNMRAALRHAGLPEYPDDNAAPATPNAHDRSALDRMLAEAREKALREAAEICAGIRQRIANGPTPEGARFDYEQAILALIDSHEPR